MTQRGKETALQQIYFPEKRKKVRIINNALDSGFYAERFWYVTLSAASDLAYRFEKLVLAPGSRLWLVCSPCPRLWSALDSHRM